MLMISNSAIITSSVMNFLAKVIEPIVIAIMDKVVLDGDPTSSDERYSLNLYLRMLLVSKCYYIRFHGIFVSR